jgi:plastocyanin
MKNYFTFYSAKTKLLLSVMAIFVFTMAGATTHTIQVANFSFTPNTLNAVVGDTVIWQWVSGTHTTTSLTVPSGAATWNAPMSSGSPTFQYVISTAGTYTYDCSIHPSVMTGTITVTTNSTSIAEISANADIKIYPNPSMGQFEVTASKPFKYVEIYDILGKVVYNQQVNADNTSVDISHEAKGVYLVALITDNETVIRKIVIGK